ncbi:MAG: hypothetical protein GYB68_08360 [Chloroflexi bacterium]|nr:hypothetical protein [Chloroflexota bacterium]
MTATQSDTLPPKLGPPDYLTMLALALLCVAFFWRMVFTDLILPRGDVFLYFYPYWDYRNALLRAGELPVWNPYLFMGTPFLANSQAGVFYPPNWLLIGLDAPTAVKIAIVSHLVWAACGVFIFARRIGKLSTVGAFAAGAAFALGGYLTAQVEHVNQIQGLAWLPWLFWLWSEGHQAKGEVRRRWLVAIGLTFGLQLLAGHTQTSFISGVGLGVWALWHILLAWQDTPKEQRSPMHLLRTVAWPLGSLALASGLALLLAAVQILPTLELTQLSNRGGGLTPLEALSFSLRPTLIGRGLLPTYGEQMLFTEFVMYPGIVGLVVGLLAAWHKRSDRRWLGLILVAGTGALLALGAYNPLYWLLVRTAPGFDLFRVPARWLVLMAFGLALLIGAGLDALRTGDLPKHGIEGFWPLGVVVVLIGLSFAAALESADIPGAAAPQSLEIVIWIATLAAVVAVLRFGLRHAGLASSAALLLICLELFIAARQLPYNDLSAPQAWSSQRPAISTLLAANADQTPPDRFLSISDTVFDPGDLREINAIYEPILRDDALFDYLVATKQKEIVAPNLPMAWGIPSMDGFDGGILPTRDYIAFSSQLLPGDLVATDGRLREFLDNVPDLAWLRMANVRWIITDMVYDAWVVGTYHDLHFSGHSA